MVHIRHAEAADAARWAALRSALWPEGAPAAHEAEVTAFFGGERGTSGLLPEAVLVALAPGPSGVVVGFVELSRRPYAEGCETSPVGFLEGWYVVPEYRRQGVGGALVLAAEAWARAEGCREFASDAPVENTASAAAHRALGFEEVTVIRCFRKSLDTSAQGRSGP